MNKKGVKIKYSKYLVYLVVSIILVPFIKADLAGATPEAYSFMKPPGPNINLFTGDMSLGVPVMTVPGRGMNFPITVSYSAGIRVGQEASWVGLGWNFMPGAITRNVNGIPDDYKAGGGEQNKNIGMVIANFNEYILQITGVENNNQITGNIIKVENVENKNLIGKIIDFFTKGNKITGMAVASVEDATQYQANIDALSPQSGFYGTPNNGLYNVDVPAGQMSQIINIMNLGDYTFCSTTYSTNGFMYFDKDNPSVYCEVTGCRACSSEDDKKYIDRMNPDSFSISGPISGGMMFDPDDKKFHMNSFSGEYNKDRDDQIKIDYETEDGVNDGIIKSFTITTKDGTKYVYDYPVYNVNQNGYSTYEDEAVYSVLEDGKIRNLMPYLPEHFYSLDSSDFKFKRRGQQKNTELFDYVSKAQTKGKTSDILFQRYFFRKFAYTWLLTKILAPNYKDETGDGPTPDDKGNWIKFNYEKTYGVDGENSPYEYRTPFAAKDETDGKSPWFGTTNCAEYFVLGSGCSQSSNTGYMEIAYLKNIETPTHNAEFITSYRYDGAEYISNKNNNYRSGRTLKKLDEIQLKRNGNLISKVKFDYDYRLNEGDEGIPNNIRRGGRLTLLKIQQFDKTDNPLPSTKFYYHEDELNPEWNTEFIAVGQKPSGELYTLDFTDVTDNHFDDFGYYWQGGTQGNHKILDNKHYVYNAQAYNFMTDRILPYNNDAAAWSLISVSWPSGSTTNFEYETKKYSQVGEKKTTATVGSSACSKSLSEYQLKGFAWTCPSAEHYGGGIRVKSVTQSGKDQSGKIYSYTTKYEYDDGIKTYGEPIEARNGYASVKSAFNPRFVGYGKTTESISSSGYQYGKIVHEFTTRNDYPPVEIEKVPLTEFKDVKYSYNYEDKSALYGLEKKTTFYDNKDNIIRTIENKFDFNENGQIEWDDKCESSEVKISTGIESCRRGPDKGRAEIVKSYWLRLKETKDTLDGVIKTISYEYNPVNGLPSKIIESGNGITKVTETGYAFEEKRLLILNKYAEMLNEHVLTKPYKTELKKGSNLISKSKTEYHNIYPYYVKSTSVWDSEKNKFLTTTFDSYDNYGNLLETTDPRGYGKDENEKKKYKTYFEYSPVYDYAYLTKGKNALGHEMLTDYNPNFGVVTSITDFNKQTTHYGYETFGRLTTVTKDNKVLNSYDYDDASFDWRKTATRIDDSHEMNLKENFDDFARLESTELKENENKNIITKTEYHPVLIDKVSKVYKPDYNNPSTLFTSTEYELDPLARLSIIDPPGAGDIRTDYSNQEGMYKTTVTDEEGRTKSSLTDVFGNLIKVIEPGNLQTTYTYDTQNNLLTITDSKGRKVTDNKYNSLGQLIESWQADTGTTKFKYDDNGNMIERNQNGVITIYTYDELNRLTGINYPNSIDVINTYDTKCINEDYQIGKLCKVSDASGEMQFGYDNWGRVIKEIKNVNGVDEKYIIEYIYNDINDITEIKLSKGSTELSKTNYEYNNLNQLVKVKINNQEISYEYNPTSTIKEITFGNNIKTTYDYTERDWIKRINTGDLFNRNYGYDKVGNLKELKDNDLLASFSYDALDRLTDVIDNNYYGENIVYTYDSVGNRLTRNDISYNYMPNNNQMIEDGSCSYTYDANGNTKTKTCSDGITTYEYDDENRLIKVIIKVTSPDGKIDEKINQYVYDANGLRTIKKDSAGTTIYIYDMNGNNIYEETI